MRILVTGSSGLIARNLMPRLRLAGHEVVRLLRPEGGAGDVGRYPVIRPDLTANAADPALDGFDAVIHLAGQNVDRRWTKRNRASILSSRAQYTADLCQALAKLPNPPTRFLCASGIGYYGHDRHGQVLTESSPNGQGFLADVCAQWEAATRFLPGRSAITFMRIAAVLTPEGGALAKMLPVFRKGLGGVMSHGRQVMAWIALPDLLRAIEFLLNRPEMTGPVNCCAPNPVTNRAFTRALAKALHRPAFFRVPKLALKAMFGRMAEETILADQDARPARLTEAGFGFEMPEVEGALRGLLDPMPEKSPRRGAGL